MNIWDYQWWWSRIGGRPWTYIIRDAYHRAEFFWIVGLVSLGVWLGHNYGWRSVLTGWLIFSAGYLAGHFFWGTPYVPGQTCSERFIPSEVEGSRTKREREHVGTGNSNDKG